MFILSSNVVYHPTMQYSTGSQIPPSKKRQNITLSYQARRILFLDFLLFQLDLVIILLVYLKLLLICFSSNYLCYLFHFQGYWNFYSRFILEQFTWKISSSLSIELVFFILKISCIFCLSFRGIGNSFILSFTLH